MELYEAIECNKCHGTDGRADGPSRPELKDDWGNPIAPANLTMPWRFRGGSAPVDVATRLANGVVGTPMPSCIDSVEKPEDVWHLANYILSLGPRPLTYATLVSVTNVSDAIPDDPDAAFWKAIAPNHIALLGQVIVDPRNFNPSIDLVSVRAVYHDKEIAFHLTWDDPTQSVEDAAKKTYADAISLQFPPQPRPGPERPYFLMGDASDGVYLLRWQNGKSDGGDGERADQDRAARRQRGDRQGGVRERPVPARHQAPARVEAPRPAHVPARGLHAGGVPGVGRRRRGDRDEDVPDVVVLFAAGGAPIEPSFRRSSGRGDPHVRGAATRGSRREPARVTFAR